MTTARGEIVGGTLHLEGLPLSDGPVEIRVQPLGSSLPGWVRAITLDEDDPTFVAPERLTVARLTSPETL